jgi:hypothetical protein
MIKAGRETLWHAVRWPLVLIAMVGTGIGVAFLLDQTSGPTREWTLTIGAPSLTLLLPGGVLWLLVAVITLPGADTDRRSARLGTWPLTASRPLPVWQDSPPTRRRLSGRVQGCVWTGRLLSGCAVTELTRSTWDCLDPPLVSPGRTVWRVVEESFPYVLSMSTRSTWPAPPSAIICSPGHTWVSCMSFCFRGMKG